MNSYFDFFGVPKFKPGGKTKKKEESTQSLGYATDAYLDEKGNYTLGGGDFNLPEFGVTPKGTFDPNAWSSEWSENDPEYKVRQQQEIEKSKQFGVEVANAMSDAGRGVMKVGEHALGFTPMWWTVPAVRTGLALKDERYGDAAIEAATGVLAPYAIGKGMQYAVRAARPYVLSAYMNRALKQGPSVAEAFSRPATKSAGTLTGAQIKNGVAEVTNALDDVPIDRIVDPTHHRVKVGDIEVNNPGLAYHQSEASKIQNFANEGSLRTTLEKELIAMDDAGTLPFLYRTGIKKGYPQTQRGAMFSQGNLWFGVPKLGEAAQYPELFVTNKQLSFANSKGGTERFFHPKKVGTRRVTSDTPLISRGDKPFSGELTPQNTSMYKWDPNYGYRLVSPDAPKTIKLDTSALPTNPKIEMPKGGSTNPSNNEATDNLIKWLGNGKSQNGQPIDFNSLSTQEKALAKMWQEGGVDLSRFSRRDLQTALTNRENLIRETAPDGKYLMHKVSDNGEHYIDYSSRYGDNFGDIRLSEKPNGLKVEFVQNTTEAPHRLKGVQETLTNGAVNLSKSLGKEGVVSGELLLTPEATSKMYGKFNDKTLLGNYGEWRYNNDGAPELKYRTYDNPVYRITGESVNATTPTKSVLFKPSIIDSKGKNKFTIEVQFLQRKNYEKHCGGLPERQEVQNLL